MTNVFFDSSYTTIWTAIGAIGQALAAILAIAALIYSIRTFSKSLKTLHYTELDKMYQDLLRIKLEKLYLNNADAKRHGDQEVEYNIYAFMVWNFLETIHDRCERDKDLCATWYPVIITENRLHRKWFNRIENQHKFKQAFRDFIQSNRFSPTVKKARRRFFNSRTGSAV